MNALHEIAKDVAQTFELEPALVCGIVEQESGWNTWLSRYEPGFFTRYVDNSRIHLAARDFARAAPYTLSFETELRERAFSRGLLQVMGQTARESGFTDPLPQLHDPETGLTVGCKYLSRLIKGRAGDIRRALLLYNGGGDPQYPDKVFARMKKYQ